MNDTTPRERLMALYADLATQGASREEMLEIERLEHALGLDDRGREEMELAAALLDPALSGAVRERAPESLRAKLLQRAHERADSAPAAPVRQEPVSPIPFRRQAGWMGGLGWLAAAASLALAAVGWLAPRGSGPSFEQVASAPDRVRWAWASGPDWTGQGVRGEVVFSIASQEGFMTFEGLPALDSENEQYQLWIIDPEQKHPIDGGVFDAPAGAGERRVPIRAKLAVKQAAAFAVTVEKRGGVVVSDQSRVSVIAKPT